MKIRLITSPFYLGHKNVGMGAGPTKLIASGIVDALHESANQVEIVEIDFEKGDMHEVGSTFAINRLIADAVRRAVEAGEFPVVLGGNCNVCLGVVGGIGAENLGVTWFDAHGDFHDSDSTGSGFFDGMPLHIATGNSWRKMASTIPGFKPVRESSVVLAGVRDLDDGEVDLLEDSSIAVVPWEDLTGDSKYESFGSAVSDLSNDVEELYIHVDLDVLAPEIAPANSYQPKGGLTLDQFAGALELLSGQFRVRAVTLACYDPSGDRENKAALAGIAIVKMLTDIASRI
ncbi:MAG: arginase family protein [Gemmatimonadota bacterium]|nr:arginase family protein [Gemmatimonadota bacterium]